MKTKKKWLALLLAVVVLTSMFSGCGKKKDKDESTASTSSTAEETTTPEATPTPEEEESGDFVELTLAVLYNDADLNYFENEYSDTVKVFKDGQYTLEFDCSKNLSDKAKDAGVTALKNLTAIYIIDKGSIDGNQSTITGANIKYDSVVVNGTELTIIKPDAKPALKDNGIFDTNDPINAWDGSAVEETAETGDHVANFTTIDNPTTISVTFMLSDVTFAAQEGAEGGEGEGSGYVNEAKFSDMDFSGMTALELSYYLGNGINLGNTMEAVNTAYGKTLDVSTYEQAWGQPVTTQAMIQGMKNCGFDTLRIPVAWTNMMDYENGDYTINTAYLDRVQEIVDWAIEAEMFVIVNDHWDGGWWDLFGKDDTRDQAWKIYEGIWGQVGERFKDYSDMLILESANEELGIWANQGMSDDDCYKLTNEINQKFVDMIRAQGGNNANRFLLIAGPNTNIDRTVDTRYVMPTDTAKSKLFVSVHFYSPTNYCLDKNNFTQEMVDGLKWGLAKEYTEMETELAKLEKLTEAGYGVIIGEYGALPAYINGASVELPCTMEYTNYFLDICDLSNYVPVLWSTGAFDKKTLMMLSREQTDMYTARCYAEESKAGDSYQTDVKAHMKAAKEAAPEKWDGQETYEPGTPVCWIMWNGGAGTYSVGDVFNSADCTAGITATNTVIEGAGEYEVSLDFAGGNDGITFTALAIADGEELFPGCIIDIKEVTLDGNAIELGKYYTASDDNKCTRVNLYNQWCGDLQKAVAKDDCNFRTMDGDLSDITATPVDPTLLTGFKNITIKFELVLP